MPLEPVNPTEGKMFIAFITLIVRMYIRKSMINYRRRIPNIHGEMDEEFVE
jgi:hypothetical protein